MVDTTSPNRETVIDDLGTWLRHVLDDDAEIAMAAADDDGWRDAWGPAARVVLADVAAKRAIINEHRTDDDGNCMICDGLTETEPGHWVRMYQSSPCTTMRLLAWAYNERAGYRPEWSPDQ